MNVEIELCISRVHRAIARMREHPDARRRPLPSVKAGRLALRELGMTRAARKRERLSASEAAYTWIGDALADAYHLAGHYGLPPEGLEALHEIRLTADPFPFGVEDEVSDLVCFFGNALQLGVSAYGLWSEALMGKGREHFDAEHHDL